MGIMNRKEFAKWKPGDKVKPKTITGKGNTKQEFRKESDINYIMKRYAVTGQLPGGVVPHQGIFADVSTIGTFGDVLNRVKAAEEAFAGLPGKLRERFHNDPVELVEFLQDERNRPEAEKLGLVKVRVDQVEDRPGKDPEPKPDPKPTPKA